MALTDLARARPDRILFDTRNETVVVLGERGRAHVFNLEGRLVTSIRGEPSTVEKRRIKGIWRDASPSEVEALRDTLRQWGRAETDEGVKG